MIIAAAGRHNILLNGVSWGRKNDASADINVSTACLIKSREDCRHKTYSLAGESTDTIVHTRPFRSPHHTASRIALIGGGNHPKPGEISLAHLGVLFLDEIPEYPRATLESLDNLLRTTRCPSLGSTAKLNIRQTSCLWRQ